MVRVRLAFLGFAALAAAQSHPTWWNLASPGATALVGVDWQTVRASPFAEPVEAELWGDLGFPDLACLHQARQIVISSPDLLAMASGNFSGRALSDQAMNLKMKPMTYRNIDMWFASAKGALSIARMTDQLVLIGEPKALEMAVDRSIADRRDYAPLLARAAKFSQKDLWVVSSRLPDDLASRFVPLDTEARGFEGSLTVRGGLSLEASLTTGSEDEANASAEKLAKAVPGFPAIARGLEISLDEATIELALTVSKEQVIASLRGQEQPGAAAPPSETIPVQTPVRVERVIVEKIEPPKPVVAAAKPVEKPAEKPQIIRIVGLDEGPKEIVLPPVKPERQNR